MAHADAAQQAAVAMRLTAGEQLALGVIDEVVPEPGGGAHENPRRDGASTAQRASQHISTRSPAAIARRSSMRATPATGSMGEFAVADQTGAVKVERPRMFTRIRRLLEGSRVAIAGSAAALPNSMTDGDEPPPLREDV